MPFLPSNKQYQSTEGIAKSSVDEYKHILGLLKFNPFMNFMTVGWDACIRDG